MEKNTPHCPLPLAKQLIQAGKVRITRTARHSSFSLGFSPDRVLKEVLALKREEFYKSMTTYADHTVWQDVYRHNSAVGMLYIKITVNEDVLVLSFKESES